MLSALDGIAMRPVPVSVYINPKAVSVKQRGVRIAVPVRRACSSHLTCKVPAVYPQASSCSTAILVV